MKSISARLGVLAPLLALAWLSACGGGDDHTIELKNETAPYPVPLARAAVQVSAGWAHTCAVLADGSAACWGGNQFGQLGNGGQALVGCADGFAVCSNGPVAVSGATTWTRVAGGFLFTCGTDAAGAAHCWGAGRRGQLGNGTQVTSNVPANVSGGLVFSALAAATGGDLACGLSAGALYCWGSGYYGQPGNGSVSQLAPVPYRVSPTQSFTALAVGEVHACALDGSGAAFCWGADDAGQVGDGTLVDRTLPVAALGGRSYTQIVAGLGHTCALDAGGVAYCWGAAGRIGRASASVVDRAGNTRRRGRRAALRADRGRRLAHLRHRQRRADVVLGRQLTRAVRRRHPGVEPAARAHRGPARIHADHRRRWPHLRRHRGRRGVVLGGGHVRAERAAVVSGAGLQRAS